MQFLRKLFGIAKPALSAQKDRAGLAKTAKADEPVSSISFEYVLDEVKKAMDEKDETQRASTCLALIRLGTNCRNRLTEIVLDKSLDFYTRRYALKIASGFRDKALSDFIRDKCIANRSKGEVLREQTAMKTDESTAQVALYITGEEILNTPNFFERYVAKG